MLEIGNAVLQGQCDLATVDAFESILTRFHELAGFEITLPLIYDKVQRLVYGELDPVVIDQIMSILEIESIHGFHQHGYLLTHLIFLSGQEELYKAYLARYRDSLSTRLTKNHYVKLSTDRIPIQIPTVGGQSVLHVTAESEPDVYRFLLEQGVVDDHPDVLGHYARDIHQHRSDHTFTRKVGAKMAALLPKIDPERIAVGRYVNEPLRERFLEIIKETQMSRPNSLHQTGVLIDPVKHRGVLQELIDDLDREYGLDLTGKLYGVYAFTADYSESTNKRLESHYDKSVITLNWNLEVSDDLTGTEVVFETAGVTVKPRANQVTIHSGKQLHHVEPRITGRRKNLIVWLN
jgi:hypothetical protein